ncbi:MAG: TNT domain-containing protein [Microbacterium sp.]
MKQNPKSGEPLFRYPSNDGVVPGTRVTYTDPVAYLRDYGTQLDRIGYPGGKYLGAIEDGKPATFEQRAMPVAELTKPYHQYQFTDNASERMQRDRVRIEVSRVAEGFGRDGGALQLRLFKPNPRGPDLLEMTVQGMLDEGYLQ